MRRHLCRCFWCEARRAADYDLYRGPSRFRAWLGHRVYRVRALLAR